MKKNLLLFVFLCVSIFTISAQNNKSETLSSQLMEQLGTQLKEQLESQIKIKFESLSNKELNLVIDSMLFSLDEMIEQSRDIPKDSIEMVYNVLSDFNFKFNDQDVSDGSLLEKEDLFKFYESFTSQSVKTRKELLSIKKIRNKDKKAQRLSDCLLNFMNESGFWELMEKMLDKMMP
ncbi:MAG: hypothetical protein PHS01_08985 [Dysgonamonadaceae bacterium]|nr:hypothetical protein [Fermentimonas sp.]MDD4399669.1 hypothetical protein [Dysgonamonadaceae bacterium]